MSARLLGIDVGTSLIKAVVFDANGGEQGLGAKKVEVRSPRPGWAEQDMEAVWEAVASASREALAAAGGAVGIEAVAVAGQGDGAWMIDADGQPFAPAPLWSDVRAAAIIDGWEVTGALRDLYRRSGTVLWAGSQAALLAWFADYEPELLARASTVFTSKDWIRYRLTGTVGTDETDASIPFMDLALRQISSGQAAILGLEERMDLLPSVARSSDVVGLVTQEAAAATGLRPGTPVAAGVLDVVANALGVGAMDGGQAMVILGTTALAAVILDEPRFEPADVGASVCHAPDGRWMRALGSMAGTPDLDWYLATMGEGIGADALAAGRDRYAVLEEEIAASPPGADGLVFHPYLLGERVPFVDPDARGSLFGLSMSTSRGDVARAVSEGIAYAIRHCFEANGTPVSDVRLCGGGSRSRTWSQILADVTGARMTVASGSQFGALGAAMVAGISVGVYPDYSTAIDRCVRIARVHEPDADAHALYGEQFTIYSDLIDAMRPIWPRLADAGLGGRSAPTKT